MLMQLYEKNFIEVQVEVPAQPVAIPLSLSDLLVALNRVKSLAQRWEAIFLILQGLDLTPGATPLTPEQIGVLKTFLNNKIAEING